VENTCEAGRHVQRGMLGERSFGFDVERAVQLTVLRRPMVSGFDRHALDWQERCVSRVPRR